MSFDQLFPVYLSTPVSHEKPQLPFRFVGGFGLSTQSVGFIVAIQGVFSLFMQTFVCSKILGRFHAVKIFQVLSFCYPIVHFIVPYLSLLPSSMQTVGIYSLLAFKIAVTVIAYPANAIQLANAAPSLLVLGTINGVAASTASLARALGPTISGMLYSYGIGINCSGLVWWVTCIICIVGAFETLLMRESGGRFDNSDLDSDALSDTTAVDTDIEALCAEAGLVQEPGLKVLDEDNIDVVPLLLPAKLGAVDPEP
jgi:hypothetical protein